MNPVIRTILNLQPQNRLPLQAVLYHMQMPQAQPFAAKANEPVRPIFDDSEAMPPQPETPAPEQTGSVSQPAAERKEPSVQPPAQKSDASRLSGPMTMRRAVIIKEILDKPLALRGRYGQR